MNICYGLGMFTPELLGIIASTLGFIGFAPYIWNILRGKTRPHIFSWYLWALFNGIAGFAQLSDGGGAGAWVNLSGCAFTLFIAVLATIKNGRKDIVRSDWYALWGAIAAIGIWLITQNPLWSVILITLIDMVAFYPTFRKGWLRPYEDMASVFSLSAIKHIIGIIALQNYTLTTWLFPASLVLTNIVFVAMILWRRSTIKNNAAI